MTDTEAIFQKFCQLTDGDKAAAASLTLADALNRSLEASGTAKPAAQADILNLKEAAVYLGLSESGLRKIVDRTYRARSGRPVNGPTIEFSQPGKGSCIRFRREWLDAFIDKQRIIPAPPKPAVIHRSRNRRDSRGLDY